MPIFDVTVCAIPERGRSFELGTSRLYAADRQEAERRAFDEHWDSRLDSASCSPHFETELIEDMRYIYGNWTHMFHEHGGDVPLRFVFDLQEGRIVALQIQRAQGWVEGGPEERASVEESITDANREALDHPEEWGLATDEELPEWAGGSSFDAQPLR